MSSIIPSLRESATNGESPEGPRDFMMTYRHWFVVSLLVLMNVVIFGCLMLAAFGKIRLGF